MLLRLQVVGDMVLRGISGEVLETQVELTCFFACVPAWPAACLTGASQLLACRWGEEAPDNGGGARRATECGVF